MACFGASEYIFREVNEGVFERRCYGLEGLVSNMGEYCDGFTHLTVSASVSLRALHGHEELKLEERIRAAWTAFRHFTPAVACKVFRHTEGDKHFAFRYTAPRTKEDVEAWLDETVFFAYETNEGKTLYEKHCELKNGRWWRCSDERYAAEVHVSPLGDDWHISLVFSHNSTDGRNAFAMLELFLEFLKQELDSETSPSPILDWGSEVIKLPPPGAFVKNIVESGTRPDINISPPDSKVQDDGSSGPSPIIPWTFSPRPTNETGDVTRLVHLSQITTAKLHALCQKKGRTITQVMTALNALAHVETALVYAAKHGSERFDEVLGALRKATHYLIPWNFINHTKRNKLPGGYDSYQSPKSAPLCSADCVALMFPMRGIKSCIKVDEETFSVSRVITEDAFWEELVSDVAAAWKGIDHSFDGYASRELALHQGFSSFTPKIFDLPLLIVSSIGDLARLGLLASFVPSPLPRQTVQQQTESMSDEAQKQTIIVNDVVCGIRVRTPPIMNLLWEYNERIACHFMSGGEYVSSEEIASLTRNFEEWTELVIG